MYRQKGPDPTDGDELIGLMDSSELAEVVVTAVNWMEKMKAENFSWEQSFDVLKKDYEDMRHERNAARSRVHELEELLDDGLAGGTDGMHRPNCKCLWHIAARELLDK